MTEVEWLGAADPTPMLEFIKSKATKRRLRLLGCASLRRVAHLLIDDRARDAIGTAERFADGLANEAELKKARMAANHCREANATHVRGCWVVDLVLGKE